MDRCLVTAIPPQYALTPDEDKLMDLIVGHMVDFYFSNPQKFIQPLLQKLHESNSLDSKEIKREGRNEDG